MTKWKTIPDRAPLTFHRNVSGHKHERSNVHCVGTYDPLLQTVKKTNGFKVCGRRVSDSNGGFWKLLGLMCASLPSGAPKWQQLSSMWRWNSLRGHKTVLNEDISPQSALAVLVKRWRGWENCKLRSVFCVTANQTLACCRGNIQSSCYMKPLNYILKALRDHGGGFP